MFDFMQLSDRPTLFFYQKWDLQVQGRTKWSNHIKTCHVQETHLYMQCGFIVSNHSFQSQIRSVQMKYFSLFKNVQKCRRF